MGELLDQPRLERMRTAAEFAEKVAPTRPHPGVESATANLLAGPFAAALTGLQANGEAIDGKQVQRPMRSVAAVFGLDDAGLPSAEQVEHVPHTPIPAIKAGTNETPGFDR